MNNSLSKYGEITLISYEICPFVQRAMILLEQLDHPYQVKYVDLTDKPDWFKNLSPTGKVPLLQVNDTILFESQVIVEFLAEAAA